MKRTFVLVFALLFASFLLAGPTPVKGSVTTQAVEQTRDDVIYWTEDFETGLNGWTGVDETAPAEEWHLSTEGAYDGNSWWMGDESIGGYTNHRYIVLDTPMLTMPAANPQMTFMMHYNMEGVGGTGDYDAWDGFNVRVSTDGTTWTPIAGSPAYDADSFYSFGNEFNEGPNVPGYGGTNDGWEEYTFDLSTYAGQSIAIRFAFASDPAACTDDGDGDESWFGVRLDDINIADVLVSDGDGAAGDDQLIPGTLNDVAGDYWAISTENYYSGEQSAHCAVEHGQLDALISPLISVPDLPEVYFSYYAFCEMIDSDGNEDNSLEDYYLVYVKAEGETAWTRLHYLFTGPDSGGLSADWTNVNQAWALENLTWQTDATCDITEFAGMDVQFKFQVKTDDNDDGGIGDGLFIDDVNIYAPVFLPSPTELTAEDNGENQIELNWLNPMASGEPGWLHWDDGENDDGIGLNSAAILDAAARFTASDLLPYTEFLITNIKFFPREADCTYTLKIWDTGATELYSQELTSVTNEAWNDIELDTPYEIQLGDELWIGYRADTNAGFPIGCDAGPAVRNTSYIRMNNGAWTELYEAGENPLDYNWNIQAYVDTQGGTRNPMPLLSRNITGYKVFRATEAGGFDFSNPIVEITDPEITTYIDESPEFFAVNYYTVVATYDDGDSQPSNEASVYVMDPMGAELMYDDGEADDDYTPSPGQQMAVKFTPYINPNVDHILIKQMKVWVEDLGSSNAVVKIWADDGENGMPGTELDAFVLATSQLTAGWNIINLSEDIEFNGNSFYMGFMGSPSCPTYGADDSTSGYSYTGDTSGTWTGWNNGSFMVRAIVNRMTGTDEELIPTYELSASNYPNPFNPTTTIRYNVPTEGKVTVKVFNTRGQLVNTLVNDVVDAGQHDVVWHGENSQGKNVSSGIYMYKVEAGGKSVMQKMLLLK